MAPEEIGTWRTGTNFKLCSSGGMGTVNRIARAQSSLPSLQRCHARHFDGLVVWLNLIWPAVLLAVYFRVRCASQRAAISAPGPDPMAKLNGLIEDYHEMLDFALRNARAQGGRLDDAENLVSLAEWPAGHGFKRSWRRGSGNFPRPTTNCVMSCSWLR